MRHGNTNQQSPSAPHPASSAKSLIIDFISCLTLVFFFLSDASFCCKSQYVESRAINHAAAMCFMHMGQLYRQRWAIKE